MSLFQDGLFTSHAGKDLKFKIECDALSDEDIATIAGIIARAFTFRKVIGVPRGGLRLAEALSKHESELGKILIVDDVYTTGMSMEEARLEVGEDCIGVVLFARSDCPEWIKPLFQLSECFGP